MSFCFGMLHFIQIGPPLPCIWVMTSCGFSRWQQGAIAHYYIRFRIWPAMSLSAFYLQTKFLGITSISTHGSPEIQVRNKRSPYWTFSSAFDHIAVIGISFCIGLRNFIQIGPRTLDRVMQHRCHLASARSSWRPIRAFFVILVSDWKQPFHRYWRGAMGQIHTLAVANDCGCQREQELSYRKQIARQLRTQFVESISVTLKSTLRAIQGHWKRNHWTDHTRLTIRRVIGRWILS